MSLNSKKYQQIYILLDAWRQSDSVPWNRSRLSLNFLKIGSLVFSGIVHDDSWPWHLVTDRARILTKKKKYWQPEFGLNGPKLGPKLGGFFYFFKCHSLVFLEIACNDSLQQWLTYIRGKIHERNPWCPNLCQRGQSQVRN